MRLGYPCVNRSIQCTANSTFRLRSYSKGNLIKKVGNNLSCLERILEFNVEHGLLFFRIGSDLVPFASHPVCRFDWARHFKSRFDDIGDYVKRHNIRISMHPGQFVLINAMDRKIIRRSVKDLEYHCDVLDAMGLDDTAKVQIHVGGIYGDKGRSMKRFMDNYAGLSRNVRDRLAIENDDRSYSLKDCIEISRRTGVPVIFDVFHHECLNNGETVREAIMKARMTWKKKDGKPMIDYSSQERGARKGRHARHINLRSFKKLLEEADGLDFDIMLEIEDKEKSALKAVKVIE
ncbi:MAG: UV DNA damage repair endonuclease UvsE [Candidatus Woesearchaeota archaeon]